MARLPHGLALGGVTFEVDGVTVLQTPLSPRPPLAAVIWIDNQYAAFTPQGRDRIGHTGGPGRLAGGDGPGIKSIGRVSDPPYSFKN